MEPLLRVERLTTVFDPAGAGGRQSTAVPVAAVDQVSFDINAGETLGLVGESGSGKSVTALSIMRLVQPPGRIAGGRILFKGRDLLDARRAGDARGARRGDLADLSGTDDRAEPGVSCRRSDCRSAARARPRVAAARRATRRSSCCERCASRIPPPRVRDYPHQLSGGMRQRVMIAIALACRPSLVIADEPTTALDVTIQAQILDLLREMKAAFHLSLLLITHDLGVIAETADRVAVMYAGRIVETGPVRQIFRQPAHPYTRGLLASMPGGAPGQRLRAIEGIGPSARRPAAWVRVQPALPRSLRAVHQRAAAGLRRRTVTNRQVLPPRSPVGRAQSSVRHPRFRCRSLKSRTSSSTLRATAGHVSRRHTRRGGRRCELQHRGRGNVRTGRRIGQRQDDHRALHPAAHRAVVWRRPLSRRERAGVFEPPPARSAARHADRLPGSRTRR